MAATAEEVVSTARLLHELRLDPGDDDAAAVAARDSAIAEVAGDIGIPLIDAMGVDRCDPAGYPAAGPSSDPIVIPRRHVQRVEAVRYWAPGDPAHEEPTRVAATARTELALTGHLRVWPLGGEWPAREPGTAFVVESVWGYAVVPADVQRAVLATARAIYDGVDERPQSLQTLIGRLRRLT